MSAASVTTRIYPAGMLYTLSRQEVERLHDVSRGDLAELVRRCALAVLNTGNESDDAEALLQQYADFRIEVEQVNRGLRLELINAPGLAFVDGRIIEGIREQLSSVIRDLVYFDSEIKNDPNHDLKTGPGITGSRCCATPRRWCRRSIRTWSSAGAATRSRATSTSTPRSAVTSWACAS